MEIKIKKMTMPEKTETKDLGAVLQNDDMLSPTACSYERVTEGTGSGNGTDGEGKRQSKSINNSIDVNETAATVYKQQQRQQHQITLRISSLPPFPVAYHPLPLNSHTP